MKKYSCIPCGHIYDPQQGDPEGKVAPETPFEHIPSNWFCPICYAGKDSFEEIGH